MFAHREVSMEFPLLTSHLDDRYSIGQPSARKRFLAALDAAKTAWETRSVTPAVVRDTTASFNLALRQTWDDLRFGRAAARDPASRAFWTRFDTAPQLDTISACMKVAQRAPNNPSREQVIDLLEEVTLLRMLVRNLQTRAR
jgi:hypothetical protein